MFRPSSTKMASSCPLTPEFPGGQDGPERPRKRLRKGTRSCWECKRRKVRCILAGPANARCEGCRRRGTACISQDLPDTPGQPDHHSSLIDVEDRLGRVEALVEHLVEYVVQDGVLNEVSGQRLRERLRRPTSGTYANRVASPGLLPPPKSLMPTTVTTSVLGASVTANYHELSQKLAEAWPSQHDLDLLLNLPVGNLGLVFSKSRCVPSSQPAIPRDMLQLPPLGSHPVLFAGKLLLLSIFLQGIRSNTTAGGLAKLDSSWHDIISRAVEAAGLVTDHDELAGSIEGIECIMMQSMYYDSAGNVRGAWIAIRRAITMAQIIGLHRGPDAPSPSLGLENMWFRLVQADRYMSLLLNLPQSSSDNVFATPTALDNRTAIEKMRRLDLLAAGRILQLTTSERTNSTITREIDLVLQQASALMPPRWWLLPSSPSDDPTPLLDQFTHFHLLFRLHIPYLLHPSHTSSKIIALTASRAMLTRFLALHHHPALTATTYCRGMALFSFTASATLCIAHLAAAQSHLEGHEDLAFLAHERQGDRGLVDHILVCLKEEEEDEVVRRMAGVLEYLVGIVEAAGEGIGCCYHVGPCLGERSQGCEVGGLEVGRMLLEEEGRGVRVCLPYLGAVEVRRREDGCEVDAGDQVGNGAPKLIEGNGGDDWALYGVDALAFEDGIIVLEEPDHAAVIEPWEGWMSSEAL